jgi:hypothetical protein
MTSPHPGEELLLQPGALATRCSDPSMESVDAAAGSSDGPRPSQSQLPGSSSSQTADLHSGDDERSQTGHDAAEEHESEEEDDEDEEEDEDEEPRLKYAYLTKHIPNLYRGGDATSTFLVGGDKMVCFVVHV